MVQNYQKTSEVGLDLYVYPYNHCNLSGFMFKQRVFQQIFRNFVRIRSSLVNKGSSGD